MTSRVYNFSPGPAVLPQPVLEEVQRDMLSLPGVGMSIVEISHRSKTFEKIIGDAEADIRELLGIPSSYHLLFLHGGASLQFSMVPMNLLVQSGAADYVVTGYFSKLAFEEASKVGLRTLTLEPEHGGPGVDSLGAAIVIEELAKGDLGVSVVIAQTLKLIQTVQAACTEEQKERFLPRIRDEDRFLLAIGLTEPDTASNYLLPYEEPKGKR